MADIQPQGNRTQSPPVPQEPEIIVDPYKIHVMIRNRRQVLIDEDVKAVTSKNDTGVFDVLPEHANFITTIKDSVTIHKLDGTEVKIEASNGVMKVKNFNVKCYIDLISPKANLENT